VDKNTMEAMEHALSWKVESLAEQLGGVRDEVTSLRLTLGHMQKIITDLKQRPSPEEELADKVTNKIMEITGKIASDTYEVYNRKMIEQYLSNTSEIESLTLNIQHLTKTILDAKENE